MARHFFHSLRARLVLLVVLLGLPLLVLTLYDGWAQRQRDTERVEARGGAPRSPRGGTRGDGRGRGARAPHRPVEHRRGDRRRPWPLRGGGSGAFAQPLPRYTNLGLADRSGTVICSAVPMKSKVNIRDRRLLPGCPATRGLLHRHLSGGAHHRRAGDRLRLSVLDPAGAVQDVVYAALDLRSLHVVDRASAAACRGERSSR